MGANNGVIAAASDNRRKEVFLLGILHRPQRGPDVPICIRNLGHGGLMADCPRLLKRGEEVEVEVRGGATLVGVVAWTADRRLGIAFEEPYDIDAIIAHREGHEERYVPPVARRAWRPSIRIASH